jgi:hypothetical protein
VRLEERHTRFEQPPVVGNGKLQALKERADRRPIGRIETVVLPVEVVDQRGDVRQRPIVQIEQRA